MREVTDDIPPLARWATQTSRSGSWNGSGRRRSGLITLNTAVFAPTPSPTMRAAKTKKEGSRRSVRSA